MHSHFVSGIKLGYCFLRTCREYEHYTRRTWRGRDWRGEVHMEGARRRNWRGLGDVTGGGEAHVEGTGLEGARGRDWRGRGAHGGGEAHVELEGLHCVLLPW